MTDKELYRYLQRIKFILNDSKGTKEENKKAIYNLKDQLESLKINCNIYFFEYKLFRMNGQDLTPPAQKFYFLVLLRLVFTKKHKNLKLKNKMNYYIKA